MVRTPRSQTKNRSFMESTVEETCWVDITNRFVPRTFDQNIELVGSNSSVDYLNKKIQRILDTPNKRPQFLLVSGPSASGKTTVIRKSIQKFVDKPNFAFYHLNCSWIKKKIFGDPSDSLPILYREASKESTAVIFIENIDQAKAEIMIDFLDDFLLTPSKVLFIAETSCSDLLDSRLLRSRYFSRHLKLTLPQPNERLEYIKCYLSNIKDHGIIDSEIRQIVEWTHCYSYDDMHLICFVAEEISEFTNTKLTIATFEAAYKDCKPINIATTTTPCKPLSWDQIGGYEEVKAELTQSLIAPLKRRHLFQNRGAGMIKGALLYGPPGCSKTLVARALATESGYNFIYIKGGELISKYVGDSESELRKKYREAMDIAPCMIFIDEIDSLAPKRSDKHESVGSRIVTTLLLELDGATESGDVITIGATNRPMSLDPALLRSGRLELHIYIPLPPESDRLDIFKVHMKPMDSKFDEPLDDVLNKLASSTRGYSGANIAAVCSRAARMSICGNPPAQHVEWRHFEEALKFVKPNTNSRDLELYEKFSRGQTPSCGDDQNNVQVKKDERKKGHISRLFSRIRLKEH